MAVNFYIMRWKFSAARGISNEILADDGCADCVHLSGGDSAALGAKTLNAVENILVATGEDFDEVVAIIPRQTLYGVNEIEHAFHSVAETGEIFLSADQPQFYAAACKMSQIKANVVVTSVVAQIQIAGIFLAMRHAGAITSIGRRTIKQGTAKVVMMIDDIIQLADRLGLRGLSTAKKRVGKIYMHTAIRAARDIESGEIGVVHQLKSGILVADEFARHDLRNAFCGYITAQRAVTLKFEKVGGEMGENDIIKHFRVNLCGMNAATLGFNLQAKAFERLSVRAVKAVIKADKAVAGEILVGLETSESVVFTAPNAAVVLVNRGDGGGLNGLCVFSHVVTSFRVNPRCAVWCLCCGLSLGVTEDDISIKHLGVTCQPLFRKNFTAATVKIAESLVAQGIAAIKIFEIYS